MNHLTRTGFRLLLWLARLLVDSALTEEQRSDLGWIAVEFSNDRSEQ